MRIPFPRVAAAACCAVPLLCTWSTCDAQSAAPYPVRAVRFVVGFPPGGGSDILARAVGARMSAAWNQPVVVENRPGANSNIAAAIVARSAPDGHTLFLLTVANAINPTLYPKLAYDTARDFSAVTNLAKVPGIAVVHPSVPARDAAQLVALARAHPGELRHGSTGVGSPHHLAGEIFKTMTGVRMVHVPYKGATPALTDTLAGHIEIYFGAMVSTLPHVRGGRLRAIGVTSPRRVAAAADIPTLHEQGLTGFSTESWFCLAVAAATPHDIVARIRTEAVKALAAPELRERLLKDGAEPVGDTPEQATAFLRAELVKWGAAVKASGARLE